MKPRSAVRKISERKLAKLGGKVPFSTIAPKPAARPWRMCRTCHRKGTQKVGDHWPISSSHPLLPIGDCGQCGERRPLVECHNYDFRIAAKPKPIRKVNPKRRKSEFARTYHSKERVAFVRGLKCSACGVVGYSENAHVLGNGGMSRKADYTTIAPLCGTLDGVRTGNVIIHSIGCHRVFDEYQEVFNRRYPDFNPEKAAADCESAWLLHIGEAQKNA